MAIRFPFPTGANMYIHNCDRRKREKALMTTLFASQALLPDGWAYDARITIADGTITGIETGVATQSSDERHSILLPAMPNLHSHAFQRAMAGLAEVRGPGADSFWSWREVMYRFALAMTPDQVEAVAAQLYVEMLEAGFSRVGEFHYLHHAINGDPYADIGEMAGRIASAARQTGIGLTLLPVLYAHSGFGGLAPNAGQRRFINDIDSFARILEASRKAVAGMPSAVVGIAPHSLRAVTPDELALALEMWPIGPVHIHVAEQTAEVDACVAWSGARPVEWLLDNAPVDGRWCLIHATHMLDSETIRMAESGAVAGLCPVTEANLGDGTFAAPLFLEKGGRFGIGSDSNVLIGIPDELRQLEYSQRLAHRQRNMLAAPGQSNGRALFDAALTGGAQALGTSGAGLAAGAPADLVTLDTRFGGKRGDSDLDAWIFANGAQVDCVYVAGRKLVSEGRHVGREAIAARFEDAMIQLLAG
jgi:formimidoylglutamate deiminase